MSIGPTSGLSFMNITLDMFPTPSGIAMTPYSSDSEESIQSSSSDSDSDTISGNDPDDNVEIPEPIGLDGNIGKMPTVEELENMLWWTEAPVVDPKDEILSRMDEGIATLSSLPDTPTRALRSTHARGQHNQTLEELVGFPVESNPEEFWRIAHTAVRGTHFEESFKTIFTIFVESVNKPLDGSPPMLIIDIDHCTQINRRGYHFCLNTDLRFNDLFNYVRAANGVFQASFRFTENDGHEGVKTSSFFPPEYITSVNKLIEMIQNATSIARSEDRSLCVYQDFPFKIEMYKSDFIVVSAFPVLYYAVHDVNLTSHTIIPGLPSFTSEALLAIAQRAFNNYNQDSVQNMINPVRYMINTDLVFDLGPYLGLTLNEEDPQAAINRGIFIQYPSELFS